MQDQIKKNEVAIINIDSVNKNKELTYLDFKREITIQKKDLEISQELLQEIPDKICLENQDYFNFKKDIYKEISNWMKVLDNPETNSTTSLVEDVIWKQIKETEQEKEIIKNKIEECYNELVSLYNENVKTHLEVQDLLQIEKSKKKKLQKILIIIKFVENLKKRINTTECDDEEEEILKNKLNEINDIYEEV